MSDLISRCELFNRLAPVQTLGEAYGIIQGMETVDAVPIRHGRWVSEYKIKPSKETDAYHCSVCHDYYTTESYNLRYCPRCGAKMDGKGNGNETD